MVTSHRLNLPNSETMNGMEDIPFSGPNMEAKRLSLGLSRKQVALGTGLSESLIYNYEKELKEPSRKRLALIGAYFSKVSRTRIKFSCEWDEKAIKEYAAFDLPQEELDRIKAALRNDSLTG